MLRRFRCVDTGNGEGSYYGKGWSDTYTKQEQQRAGQNLTSHTFPSAIPPISWRIIFHQSEPQSTTWGERGVNAEEGLVWTRRGRQLFAGILLEIRGTN